MKASNIILTTVIASITLFIITGALQLRFSGDKKNQPAKVQKEKIALPYFQHLIINDIGFGLIISSGSIRSLNSSYHLGNEMPTIDYHVEGDTLFIDGLQRKSKTALFELIIPHDVQLIQGENASIQISNYNGKSLNLSLNKTSVSIHGKSHIRKLSIKSVNGSDITTYAGPLNLDTLQISLNNSEATIQNSVTQLKGIVFNNSKLTINDVDDLDLKKDATSNLRLF